ncbi:EamA-like transporter family protein [Asanoa hainanensis]|uniref:EamA-like transporter family protein n=1 Tax=Asanoa hainanensis TaxID=560556 RepID=A0A239JNA8_9ACTN|nr:EamA family transporter [Asanoa hainanensis]SNT07506.1 EamA-like transporter family protein [Asanoa hainanensis]
MSPWAGPAAVVAVLAAAVLHATWNAVVKGSGDQIGIMARSSLVGAAASLVAVWFIEPPARASWGFLIASVVIHVFYNLGLLAAYRLGDFNQTYPLARGLGPVVVAVFAALVLHEPLAPLPAVGVLVIAAAIGVLGLTPWRRVRANRPAVLAAVFTGLTIATYTLVDGVGVRRSEGAAGYTLWLCGLEFAVTALVAFALRKRVTTPLLAASGRAWLAAAAVTVLATAAYGLVLWAQTRGALAAVAALRESSVVVAAVIGMIAFKEPMGRVRVAASVAVALGVALLALPAA